MNTDLRIHLAPTKVRELGTPWLQQVCDTSGMVAMTGAIEDYSETGARCYSIPPTVAAL